MRAKYATNNNSPVRYSNVQIEVIKYLFISETAFFRCDKQWNSKIESKQASEWRVHSEMKTHESHEL